MMRLSLCGLALLVCVPLLAEPIKLEALRAGAMTYTNVTVLGVNETDLYFSHAGGFSNVKLKVLDKDLQKRFGYDPRVAEQAERQRSENDSRYIEAVANSISEQAQHTPQTAEKVSRTSEESLADPVSDRSLLGKAAPALDVDKWLNEKPNTQGKFVLVNFWAPWSLPCRKAIPQLNALQKKFADKLTVVGICSEPAKDIEELGSPKIEFSLAIDSRSRVANAARVASIPYALLLDAKGIVRYEGHPAAIDDKKLEQLLSKAAAE